MIIYLQCTRFPPYNIGGEEIHAQRLYESLSKENTVFVINNTIGEKFKDGNILNLSCRNNSILFTFFFLPNPKIFLRLLMVTKNGKPDVIHINNPHTTFSTELFFLPKKYPKIWEIHDYSLFCLKGDNILRNKPCNRFNECWKCLHQQRLKLSEKKDGNLLRKFFIILWKLTNFQTRNRLIYGLRKTIIKKAIFRTNRIICPSINIMKACRNFGVKEEKLLYLPYGIDLSNFKPTEIPKRKLVGFVGRLEKVKGCHILITAFEKVLKQIPNAHLLIVGDGSKEKKLKKLVNSLGINKHVSFLGRKSPEDLRNFYQKVQFLVFPSLWLETPALVTYEAMASGRPVIATETGDFSELIKQGANGYLFKRGDANDLAKKIIYLLRKPNEIRKLAKNALKTVAKYSLEKHNQKLLEIYRKAIDSC